MNDPTWRVITADVLAGLAQLPDESVQTVVTSPPYWGLRDYGQDGQIGLEASPAEYVEALVGALREVRRVLRSDGTVWLNLGDSYAGSRSGAETNSGLEGSRRSQTETRRAREMQRTVSRRRDDEEIPRSDVRVAGLKPKDLVGIPWRVAFALQADGWYLRSDIIWAKPNPMPESVTDRPTKAHEYVFLLSRSQRYFYDAAAVRSQLASETKPLSFETMDFGRRDEYAAPPARVKVPGGWDQGEGAHRTIHRDGRTSATYQEDSVPVGANMRDVWSVATEPFPDAHFATFPKALVVPCVKAGSAPGDTVLDPFAGSGTVGVVALRLGRSFVGIELSPEYAAMARDRIRDDAPMFNTYGEVVPV